MTWTDAADHSAHSRGDCAAPQVDGVDALRVYCLGVFRVVRPGDTSPIGVGSTQKAWALFKYLVSRRGTAAPTSEIIRVFWPKSDSDDNTSQLRTTLSRLKSMLEPGSRSYSRSSYLTCARDVCAFNPSAKVWIDVEEFERTCAHALKLRASDEAAAGNLFCDALELYRGYFLAEDPYSDWTVVPREHYRRLFMESSKEAARILMGASDCTRARAVLQHALAEDSFAEELHILYARALMGLGDWTGAADHYSYSTGLLYRELGISPSEEYKQLYQDLREHQPARTCKRTGSDRAEPDRKAMDQSARTCKRTELEEMLISVGDAPGALKCDVEVFHQLLALERRRVARTGEESSVVFVTVGSSDSSDQPDLVGNGAALDRIEAAYSGALRKGDAVCRFDDAHLVFLLTSTDLRGAEIVAGRIRDLASTDPQLLGVIADVTTRALDPVR
ncbi:MAG: BTAD domain-containing putative transcriptional regulator [Clostridia bacterium]|nr:BTAD domain-containing putative transcriptional regulator [Clostridia bacterium]